MRASSEAQAAQGKVQVEPAELKVEVKNIAPADRVFSGTTQYVVWLKPENGHPQNIGVLSPDKKLNAKLETKTAFTSFVVLVTAESTAQPVKPSGNEVMSANVNVASSVRDLDGRLSRGRCPSVRTERRRLRRACR